MMDKTFFARAGMPTRRYVLAGVAEAFGGLALSRGDAFARAVDEISRTAEAIHQEPVFKASRRRVYEALTDAGQFDKVQRLSAAIQSGMASANKTAEIGREAGGAFALFGGYITGRQIELLPGERIVEAWRVGSWAPGVYSIAKFELADEGAGTKIIFDHTGFPAGQAQHLAGGWKENYWEPLGKYLG